MKKIKFKYRPGDLVLIEEDGIKYRARVMKASVCNGQGEGFNSNEPRPKEFKLYSGYEVSYNYSLTNVRKCDWGKFKIAWWDEKEIIKLLNRPIN